MGDPELLMIQCSHANDSPRFQKSAQSIQLFGHSSPENSTKYQSFRRAEPKVITMHILQHQ